MQFMHTVFRVLVCLCMAGTFAAGHAQSSSPPFGTPGQFAVSPSGAATYRIPIEVPLGVAGMAPKLELVYNSQSGNGLLGMGWSLSGLSAISRCPRTMASDGARGAVNFDANDRFCLDGQRLILVSGTYGAAGSEYRTELESFSQITAVGSAGSGPASFVVKTKGGLTMEYGNTADSQVNIPAVSTAKFWSLNKMTDVNGNFLTISYYKNTDNSVQVPTSIGYGGNAAIGTASQMQVNFEYDLERPDKSLGYLAGNLLRLDRRLSTIKTRATGALVKEYRLLYAQNGSAGQSRVIEIQQWAADSQTNPAVSIAYSEAEAGAAYLNPIYKTTISSTSDSVLTGDFNGDGLTDLYFFQHGNMHNRLHLSRGNGKFTYQTPLPSEPFGTESVSKVLTGDFNGDGLSDVFVACQESGMNRLYLNQGGGQFSEYKNPIHSTTIRNRSENVLTGDFNGDGLTDLHFIAMSSGANRLYLSRGNGGFRLYENVVALSVAYKLPDGVQTGDFNGDGLTDLYFVWKSTGQNRLFLSLGNGQFQVHLNPVETRIMDDAPANVLTGDFNGDGLSDLYIAWAHGRNRLYLSRGDGRFNTYVNPIEKTAINGSPGRVLTGDFNGDGLTDLYFIWHSGGANRLFLSQGNGQFRAYLNPVGATAIADSPDEVLTGDYNGDGLTDVFFTWKSLRRSYLFTFGVATPDRVVAISQGAGSEHRITYQPLTHAKVYTKDAASNKAAYPKVDVQGALYVVSKVAAGDGLGGQRETQYSFGGLKAELGTGRGMLGFRWVKSLAVDTQLERYTEYRQDYPYVAFPARTVLRLAGAGSAGVLKRNTITYQCIDPGNAGGCSVTAGKRYFVYPASTVEQAWDLDGSAYPSVTETLSYGVNPDGQFYGEVASVKRSTSDGFSQTTVNEYYPADTAKWLFGRVKNSTVTSTRP